MNCGSITDTAEIVAIVAGVFSILAAIVSGLYATSNVKLKNKIAGESKRKEILLTQLREQQAVVFEELYEKFVSMFQKMWTVTTSNKDNKEEFDPKLDTYSALADDFWKYFTTHRIFIPTDIDNMITKCYLNLQSCVSEYTRSKVESTADERTDARKASSALRDECENIQMEIKKRFRIILGVDDLYAAASNQPM
jgi:hypothetical protein